MHPSLSVIAVASIFCLSIGANGYLLNPSLELRRVCYMNMQCNDTNSFCNIVRNRCQCNFGYEPRLTPFDGIICQQTVCSSETQCWSIYGLNTTCNPSSQRCVCEKDHILSYETQTCVHRNSSAIPIIPIIPVNPYVPPTSKIAELGTTCGYNNYKCGAGALCLYNKCRCPTGYYPSSDFNCSKIACQKTADCLVYEPHSFCSVYPTGQNSCECLYGVDFTTQRCSKEEFFPSYSPNSSYSSFLASYLIVMIFVFLLALVVTVVKSCRTPKAVVHHRHSASAPKHIPPPPYQTKA